MNESRGTNQVHFLSVFFSKIYFRTPFLNKNGSPEIRICPRIEFWATIWAAPCRVEGGAPGPRRAKGNLECKYQENINHFSIIEIYTKLSNILIQIYNSSG